MGICTAQQPPHQFASAAKRYDAVLREAAELLIPLDRAGLKASKLSLNTETKWECQDLSPNKYQSENSS